MNHTAKLPEAPLQHGLTQDEINRIFKRLVAFHNESIVEHENYIQILENELARLGHSHFKKKLSTQ